MELKFNQAELAKITESPELERFIGDLGQQVADHANARARRLFESQGGGGIGSIESHIEHDDRGTYARIAYPPQHSYMNIHELGSKHEKPRPHLRLALFAVVRATGGKESAITRVKQNKAAQRTTKRNRAFHKARKV